MSEQNHIDIVVAGFNETKSDDEILKQLYEAGVEFSDLRSTFNTIVSEKGLRLNAKERKIKTADLMDGWVPVEGDEASSDLLAQVAKLKTGLAVSDSKALQALKAWAKENKIELPKTPRKVKEVKVGFGGHVSKILDHAKENQDCTRETLAKFCEDSDIPVKYAVVAFNVIHFARTWNDPEGVVQEAA